MKKVAKSVLMTVLCMELLLPSTADANQPMLKNEDMNKLRQRIYDDWAPSKAMPVGKHVDVTYSIASDGKLYDVKLEQSSGDAQLDADCVQAVLGVSAFCPMARLTREGELCHTQIYFDSKTRAGHNNSGISKYFAAHPEQEAEHVAYYRIPLDVLKRYPGLFSEAELFSDSNFFTLRDDSTDGPNHGPGLSSAAIARLRYVYQSMWIPFFLKFPSATKQQILDHRDNPGDKTSEEQAGAG